ncbi:MAG TPA: methyltransferase domain-containing protein [Thermoanaerobaculaceae bacterium]|nr:methyltransferase domain-containing protein [Thermoanaerobaculaceae bacterium]
MAHAVCPWWLGYWLVSPVRKLVENPRTVLAPFVRDGSVVLEPGCGMGFFTIDAARLAGTSGRVIAVDIQPRMLATLARRAARAGVLDRIETRTAGPRTLGIADLAGRVDVALALHVVHELPDPAAFFGEVAGALKAGGQLLFAEPKGHVSAAAFARSTAKAEAAGFRGAGALEGLWGRTRLLVKA